MKEVVYLSKVARPHPGGRGEVFFLMKEVAYPSKVDRPHPGGGVCLWKGVGYLSVIAISEPR